MSNEIETKTVETEARTAEQTPESAQAPEKRVIIESSMNENDALALNRAAFKRFLWLFLLLGGVLLVVGILGLFDPEEGSVGPILLMVFAAAVPFLGYALTMWLARKSIKTNAAVSNDMRQRFGHHRTKKCTNAVDQRICVDDVFSGHRGQKLLLPVYDFHNQYDSQKRQCFGRQFGRTVANDDVGVGKQIQEKGIAYD